MRSLPWVHCCFCIVKGANMSCMPTSSLEPFFAAMCALQLVRIMLQSSMRWHWHSHLQEVVRIRTLYILNQFESGFKLWWLFSHPRLTFQPQLPNPVLMADTSPSTQCYATRTMNVDQHPGLAIPVRKRCTKAEMAWDKALQEEKKATSKWKALHTLWS